MDLYFCFSQSQIDYEKDWKLVTIFIGANDLCAYNKDKNYYSSENYFKYLQAMTIPENKCKYQRAIILRQCMH